MKDEQFMKSALEVALTRTSGKYFGAVVVHQGTIVASAYTTTIEDNDPTNHAEIKAIRQAAHALGSRRLNDCILYSTCEPCMMCTGAVLWAQISEVVFAVSVADFPAYFANSKNWQKPIESLVPSGMIVRRGILRNTVMEVLKGSLKSPTPD